MQYDDNIAMFAKNTFKSTNCSDNKQLLCHPQSSVAKEYNEINLKERVGKNTDNSHQEPEDNNYSI